ncbi:MAG: methyltransferase domain-containing protein [Planctomycetota bacterium]|nr:MAG: methyltransferase domain-containing protein [Planctomycetota bacterium]
MSAILRDYFEFFRQFRSRFETTGAIAPSSRFLARALTRPLADVLARSPGPLRILEVGPGTGAVTARIVTLMRDGDELDLVELNEDFVRRLQERIARERSFRRHVERLRIHRCPFQEYQAEAPYDFVISGLPLNNFPVELVERLFQTFFEHLKPGGVLSYFEYAYIRSLKRRIARGPERKRLDGIERIARDYQQRYRLRRDTVLLNLPPAWAQHLRRPPSTEQAAAPEPH